MSKLSYESLLSAIEKISVGQANYQPVMLKKLLVENEHVPCTKKDIAIAISKQNLGMKKDISFFMSIPVYEVLLNKKLVKRDSFGAFFIDADLTPKQRAALIAECNKKIKQWSAK